LTTPIGPPRPGKVRGPNSTVSPEFSASRFLAKPASRFPPRRLATREEAVPALSDPKALV
jgi:hypothetical protein